MDLLSAATCSLVLVISVCTVISYHNKDSDGEMTRWAPAHTYIYGSCSSTLHLIGGDICCGRGIHNIHIQQAPNRTFSLKLPTSI